ncbi:hypothetical protein RO3G_08597 [Rhizopus delemar RA 99-880]|uniref:Rhomboid-type serine protease n=1 Tax=Rhizopus delemar (strain RA 99-880 / ATCC MYA-4621 / FGSC 9543 / NRRL 43880) TaxID=246409 RepID=I1C612_RHIO9|nr:hypothetical protein RO3G_08597 [Rhizopus delemar RA 99-880]|eukprot:EIE83892.1 hypothetical protein RO3G_08597 [Rhizopus delemar RA 99-880]
MSQSDLHKIDTTTSNQSRHMRQLSHVQFVKRTYTEIRYPPPSNLVIPLFEDTPKEVPERSKDTELFKSFCIGPREFFELNPFNGMIGPSIQSTIQIGARFAPCMKPVDEMPADQVYICLNTTSLNESLSLFAPSTPHWLDSSCSLVTICGMTPFHRPGIPDQTIRFMTPLVIHSGLIHLSLNAAILLVTGIKLEKAINPLRTSLLFIGSGIFGHVLGANFAMPLIAYLGCSSSFFGYIGYYYVDALLHWKR